MHSNKVTFQYCNFTTNDAKVAGGTAIFSSHTRYASSEAVVLFFNCLRFIRNRATAFGGAIYFETSDKHEFVSTPKCFIHPSGLFSSRTLEESDRSPSTEPLSSLQGFSVVSGYPTSSLWVV